MSSQVLSKVRPQSRLVVFGVWWISRASAIFQWTRFGTSSFTLAGSHSTWCPDIQACTAMPFLLSHLFTVALCLVSHFLRVLPLSPMYTYCTLHRVRRKQLLSCLVQGWAASRAVELLASCPCNHKSLGSQGGSKHVQSSP